MTPPRVRVLIADDSAFARKVLREVLSCGQIEVVGVARDGLEALEKIAELKPDVLTLDLVMPNLDGVGVLRALPAQGAPRVVVVSMSGALSALGLEALHAGAIDIVQKPTALATDRMYELGAELRAKVIAVAGARLPNHDAVHPALVTAVPHRHGDVQLIVIGTSTGGPQALGRLLAALPADLPVPIAIALHIPEGYTEGLARRLDLASPLTVKEAADDMLLTPGLAVLAPGGQHLRIVRNGAVLRAAVSRDREQTLHVPSVDILFESAALAVQGHALGVILTGMGSDGVIGARRLHAAGSAIVTESESSCVVYGMPRSVREAGLAAAQAPLEQMAALIVDRL